MMKKVFIFSWIVLLIAYAGSSQVRAGDDHKIVLQAVVRDNPHDLENGRFLLEFSPCYYKYKSDSNDWVNAGVFLKMDAGPSWELSIGSDFLSYQSPNLGFSDIYVGAKWKFYEKDSLTMAVTGYVDFPTGHAAFREPGIEPTLALLIGRKIGNFEIGASVGSTYAADSQGDPCYLDFEASLELDYTPDAHNSFAVFTYGYTPDQRDDGNARITAGMDYTYTINARYAVGMTLLKGLSSRGKDWSMILYYDFSF
jgi:hypothetical protein